MVTCLFDLNTASANYGKLVVTVTVVEGLTVSASVLAPDTVNYPLSLSAGVAAVGFDSWVGTLDLIEDVDGNFLQSNYTVNVIVNEGEVDEENLAETFCLKTNQSKDLSITTLVDCFAKVVVVTDATVYPDGSTQTRSIRVVHPVIVSEADEADSTTTTDELIVSLERDSGVSYENTQYTATVTSINTIAEVVGDMTFQIRYNMTSFQEDIKVMCNLDGCGIIACVDEKIQEIKDRACKRGGMSSLSTTDKDTLTLLQMNLAMYNFYISCKDYDKINFYYNELKAITGDCDCAPENVPVAIPDTNIVYLTGPQGEAGESYEFTEWIEVDANDFDSMWKQGTVKLRYRLSNHHIEFLGSFTGEIGGTTNSNPFNLLDAFNTLNPAGDVAVADIGRLALWDEELIVGNMFRSSVDGKWKVYWNGDFTRSRQIFVSGSIPLV